VLSFYDWLYGVAQLAVGFLAIIAGFICISVFISSKSKTHRAWRPLMIALIFFVAGQVIGGLRTFGIVPNTGVWIFAVHVLVSGILALMIMSLTMQININRGWLR
jgi:hypothetical protein